MKKTTPPLISIIIPTFNRETLLRNTLESVRKQTYENFECIVVDDGSTDHTPDVVKRYQTQDSRFRLLLRDRLPKGASVCRNIGWAHATAAYMIFLDSDDVLSETCLEHRVAEIARYPDFDFWVFPTGVFTHTPGDTNKIWNMLHKDTNDLVRFLLQDMPWHIAGPVWRREAVARLQGFDEGALCWQDWEFHLRALSAGLRYHKTDTTGVDSYYRKDVQNPQNSISRLHHDIRHVLYRTGLIDRFHDRMASPNQTQAIRFAFSVLYYRLLSDMSWHPLKKEMRALIIRLRQKGLFSPVETAILNMLAENLPHPGLQRIKNTAIKLLLAILNRQKFFNRSNATFLSRAKFNKHAQRYSVRP